MNLIPFYDRCPIRLQELTIGIQAAIRKLLREGRSYRQELDSVQKSQWLSEEELQTHQREYALKLIRHAEDHVAFYQNLFKREGIHARDFQGLEDFSKIPYLTKNDVFAAGQAMLSKGRKGPKLIGHTSGTTGLSMTAYQDVKAIIRENAFVSRQLIWAGYTPGERRAWIRGDKIVPATQTTPPFWRFNSPDNMLMMSSYHLSEANAEDYLSALERFDPMLIQAYPSSVAFLAKFLKTHGREYRANSLKGVVTSSETLSDEQRSSIEENLRCKVFDWYGSMERVAAIGTCERGNYHVLSDYSFVELIPTDEKHVFEIVGTGFNNFLMPFIRYRMGDLVVQKDPGSKCACGRAFPLVERILGRMDDYIVTPDGRQIAMMINMFDGLETLLEAQVVQNSIDELRIVVVPSGKHDSVNKSEIENRARKLVGHNMAIHVEIVHEIPRSDRGKFRAVIRAF